MNQLSHVAIIMDGNGRWAQKKNKPRTFGHKHGINNIKSLIQTCQQENVNYLTLYVFSVNNWKRSKQEVNFLLDLFENYLTKNSNFLIKNNIKLKIIGEKKNIKKKLLNKIRKIQLIVKKKNTLTVILAFNYSSRLEIIKSANKLKKIKNLSVKSLNKNLYSGNIPDPDILIRTGGYSRLSDFLLWQLAYTEIFFIKKLWPDFNNKDLVSIIKKYKKVKRNFGGVDE